VGPTPSSLSGRPGFKGAVLLLIPVGLG
jgi:hypothetical protein